MGQRLPFPKKFLFLLSFQKRFMSSTFPSYFSSFNLWPSSMLSTLTNNYLIFYLVFILFELLGVSMVLKNQQLISISFQHGCLPCLMVLLIKNQLIISRITNFFEMYACFAKILNCNFLLLNIIVKIYNNNVLLLNQPRYYYSNIHYLGHRYICMLEFSIKLKKNCIRRPCLLDLWDEIDNMTPKKRKGSNKAKQGPKHKNVL